MENPALPIEKLAVALGNAFYQIVPTQYRTYCALTAQIVQRSLQQFGKEAILVPCEVWHVSPGRNCVVGFHQSSASRKWPGHVICMSEGWLIDAALHHFQIDFGLVTPSLVVQKAFDIASNVIGRYDLTTDTRLWWHHPPHDKVLAVPMEPEDLVAGYADALTTHVRLLLADSVVTVPGELLPEARL